MQIRFLSSSFAVIALCFVPVVVSAYGYSYGYGEGTYYGYGYGQGTYYGYGYGQSTYYGYGQSTYYGYGQSTYYGYGQGSYQTTFTKNVAELGNFTVSGNISKSSGSFVIDHPLDPANKLLFHSFVESPDVKNIYDGVATLDSKGEATIQLPTYFDALNKDVRYQVKPIDTPMPDLHIKTEEKNNTFAIGGGVPGGKVSWQITGIRHDPYIEANPIVPEVEKGPDQLVKKGEYLFPEGYEPTNWFLRLLVLLGV